MFLLQIMLAERHNPNQLTNHILYGYQDGTFFEEQIDSPEEFHTKVNALKKRFGSIEQIAQKQDVQLLLESITGKEHF